MRAAVAFLGVVMLASFLRAEVRPPAVAGSFYPGDARQLRQEVMEYLGTKASSAQAPVAVIAPHAGYVFSGSTAGKAFASLAGATVKRVVLLGPSHQMGFSGGALPDSGTTAFATPLGALPIDREASDTLRKYSEFSGPERAHSREHCLEVELPFLQVTLGTPAIVPILVGNGTTRELALAMAQRLAEIVDKETVVVVSTDFTHHGATYRYAPFGRDASSIARLEQLGRATGERAAALDARGFFQQVDVTEDTVCGARPVTVLIDLLAHAFSGTGRVVDVTTSASVSRDPDTVVTYVGIEYQGSWTPWRADVPTPPLGELDKDEQTAVLALARATLQSHLTHEGQLAGWFARHRVGGNLAALAGVFVTIHNTGERIKRDGRLRGCIGVIEAREPLVDAIVHSAVSAAHDPRFPALEPAELDKVTLEVSVLSPMKQVPRSADIVLGTHGVLLGKGGRHAVFLPQVATETKWDLPTFLSQLSLKAGLPRDAWREGATFEVFTAQVFGEAE
jgi:AmmeMemoRadiSam system protein B/AmmeMemoRadiSam system protein A